ncbi:Lrp/AsnC family transcriptional regulator [Helcobacillus massiliensis]
MRMDQIDARVIGELKANSRIGYADLGDAVGLSASAAKRRVDRLVERGIITGFTITLRSERTATTTEAVVELFCRGTVPPQALARALSQVPEVVEASTVTGEADALVTLRARSVSDLETALEKVRDLPSVDHTRSAVILSRVIESR